MSSCADDPGILTHPALANGFRSIGEHLKLPFSARAWARCNSLIARRLRGNHAAPQTRSGPALDPRRWLFAATLRCAQASTAWCRIKTASRNGALTESQTRMPRNIEIKAISRRELLQR